MARERSKAKAVDGRVRFVDVPTRRMLVWDYQVPDVGGAEPSGRLVDDGQPMGVQLRERAVRGAVVRLVVRHRKGQENRAREIAATMASSLKDDGAAFVRRPEFVLVGEPGAEPQSIAGEAATLRPSDLFKRYAAGLPGPQQHAAGLAEVLDTLAKMGDAAAPPAAVLLASIDRLQVRGLMAFGPRGADLVLGEGVYGIAGRFEGEEGCSNRSGKTVLLDVVEIAAYGACSRKLKKNEQMINDAADRGSVEMAFTTLDGGKYVVARTFHGSAQTASLTYAGRTETRLTVVNERMVKLLGVAQKDFVRTCFARQGDLAGLLGADNAGARRDIARWTGLDVWEPVNKDLRDRVTRATASLEATRAALERRMEVVANPPPGYIPNRESVDELRRAVEALAGRVAAVQEVAKRRATLEDSIRGREEELEQMPESLAPLRARLAAAEKEARAATAADQRARESVTKRKAMLGEGKRGEFSGMCPVDGCECPRTAEINSDRKRRAAAQAAYEAACDDAAVVAKRLNGAMDEERQARRELAEADALLKRKPAVTSELARLRTEIKAVAPGDVEDEERKLDEMRAELEDAIRAGERVATAKEEAAKEQARADTLEVELEALRWAARATSREGVVGSAMRESIERIQAATNDVLDKMGAPLRLEWDEDGQGKLAPMAVDVSGRRALEQDSGGGCDLLAIGVRVALSRMLGSPVLFLDEIDGRLDPTNLAALGDMLRKLDQAGLRQVFVVSHRPEIAEGLGQGIMVTRNRQAGTSVAEVV